MGKAWASSPANLTKAEADGEAERRGSLEGLEGQGSDAFREEIDEGRWTSVASADAREVKKRSSLRQRTLRYELVFRTARTSAAAIIRRARSALR